MYLSAHRRALLNEPHISRNDVEFSLANDAHFHLYRLFEFRKSPRLFDLKGPVERNCLLNPISYVGRFS